MTATDQASREARLKEVANRAFTGWLQQPLVKMTLATLPPSDNPDALRELLRAAFDAGTAAGQTGMAIEMIQAMVDSERRR
jgi:hypothetical protein